MWNRFSNNAAHVIFLLGASTSQNKCDCEIPYGNVTRCFGGVTPYYCDEGYNNTTTWLICSPISAKWVPISLDNVTDGLCIPEARFREDMCPFGIKNGNIVWHCDRHPGSNCMYDCEPGCIPNRSSVWLICRENGAWDVDTDRLCTHCRPITTTVAYLCPAMIPRGRIVPSCDRRLNSNCSFTCDTGCSRQATKLFCKLGFHWDSESNACYCSKSNTPSYSSPTGIAGSVMIGGVAGGVLLAIILVVGCVGFARNRHKQSRTSQCAVPQGSEYQTSVTGVTAISAMTVSATSPIHGITSMNCRITPPNDRLASASDANSSHIVQYYSLQTRQNSENNTYAQMQPSLGNNSFTSGPPSYSTLAPVVPQEDPPSYEQVTSNPVEFNL